MQRLDVEIPLMDATTDELDSLQSKLPSGFYIEDNSDRGWGLAIRTTIQCGIPILIKINSDDFYN